MDEAELLAIERGDFCRDHKVVLKGGVCEHCIMSVPAWTPGPHYYEGDLNWTTIAWFILCIIGVAAGIYCYFV